MIALSRFAQTWKGPGNRSLLVIGTGETWQADANKICRARFDVLAVNNATIYYLDRIDHAASLHFDEWRDLRPLTARKGNRLCEKRQRNGGNSDFLIHSPVGYPGIDMAWTEYGWGKGSSGLFGVYVGLGLGYQRIVLAGIPLSGLYLDHYQREWLHRLPELKDRVWSLSGWTRALLGAPPWIVE